MVHRYPGINHADLVARYNIEFRERITIARLYDVTYELRKQRLVKIKGINHEKVKSGVSEQRVRTHEVTAKGKELIFITRAFYSELANMLI